MAARAALPVPISMSSVLGASKQCYGSRCLEFLMCAQVSMHAIAHKGCMHTVRESALEADPERKIPCDTGDLNQSPYCAQMLMHAIAHKGCTHTVRESALEEVPWEKNPLPHRGLEPKSVLCTDVDACDCTRRLHAHCKRVCTRS